MISIKLNVILLALLFALVSAELDSDTLALCPSFDGSVFKREFSMGSGNLTLAERVVQRERDLLRFCGPFYNEGRLDRSACYSVLDEEMGIVSVDPTHYFPFLSFRSQTVPDLPTSRPVPEAEKGKIRIAYLIMVHHNPAQLKRMIHALYQERHTFVIHVDKRFQDMADELIEYYRDYPNIHVISPIHIVWGGIEMIWATLEGLFTLLDVGEWDYAINLSGRDYPLCSDDELSSLLSKLNGRNFDFAYWSSEETIEYRHRQMAFLNSDGVTCRPVLSITPLQIDPVKQFWEGSQWFVYTREFVHYIRTDLFPARLLAYYEATWVPDESYLSTLLMNSPYNKTWYRNTLHLAVFEGGSDHPKVWGIDDAPELLDPQKSNSCFARKFELHVDTEILDAIDDYRKSRDPKDYLEHHVHQRW